MKSSPSSSLSTTRSTQSFLARAVALLGRHRMGAASGFILLACIIASRLIA